MQPLMPMPAEVPLPAIGLFSVLAGLLALAIAIPIIVILLVSPRTRPAVLGTLGVATLGLLLLSMVAYRTEVHMPPPPTPVTATVNVSQPIAPPAGPVTVRMATAAGSHQNQSAFESVLKQVGPPDDSSLGSLAAAAGSRPAWVDEPPRLEDQVYRVPVKSGLWTTEAECQRAMDEAIRAAVGEYAVMYLNDKRAADVLDFEPVWVRHQVVRQPLYAETSDSTVGKMWQLHALLEFDDQTRTEMHRLWRQGSVSDRLRYAGAGFALALASLGAVFTSLRLDRATGGAHTRRLRWGAALAILLVAAGAAGFCAL